ncbi:MAG TPA: DinB family protein [Longimicrobiales bacterium]|nr:DinB family protein [Longimicrobiales bacterium]
MSDRVLSDAIEAFGFARQGTIGEATNIPVERWDFRPHPHAKSVSELVRHIIEAGLMLVGEAADPDGDFTRRSPAEHVADHAGHLPATLGPGELMAALSSSLATCNERILAAGEHHWSTPIKRFDGESWTRLTYIFHATAHEQYHCGQLATYARSMGLVPALTKRIHGSDAS